MLILLAIGFVAGIVTALSPCVLPVLPIVLAGGATGRRPLAIVAGIVVSFTIFTLFAAWLLDLLGLPQDLLRNLAIAMLLVVALTLLVPQAGELLARPLQALTRRGSGDLGGGFFLGASLGLVFVPCAGPVLAAVTVIAARRDVGLDGLLLTLAYALGAALPMLAIAVAGQRAAKAFRTRAESVRRVAGVLVAAAAVAIALGVDQDLQTVIPGYTESLQERFERSSAAKRELGDLTGSRAPKATADSDDAGLEDFGPAPEFRGLVGWINSEPLTLKSLRGRVVLIDFWTYSCINCLRTLPHIREWDDRYRAAGLTIVGVHTPEFAFERVPANVRENVKKLELRYPVALDNDFGTWEAWHNQYWPAKYLIDRKGHVRYYHFGEGEYATTEEAIRTLLGVRMPRRPRTSPTTVRTASSPPRAISGLRGSPATEVRPSPTTPSTPTGCRPGSQTTSSLSAAAGRSSASERSPGMPRDSGSTTARATSISCSPGTGSVRVLVDGKAERTVRVTGDRLYTLVERPKIGDHLLELRFSPGVAGYAFTFG